MAGSIDPTWTPSYPTYESQTRAEAIRRLLDEADAREAALLQTLVRRGPTSRGTPPDPVG